MVGQVGRPPSAKTLVDRQLGRNRNPLPIHATFPAPSFNIPNHSGDHSAGHVSKTPTADKDLVNKAYVDSVSKKIRTFNINRGAVSAPTYLQSNSLVHSATTGIVMNRDGYIVGLGVTLLCSILTSAGEVYISVKKNDVEQFFGTVQVTGAGSFKCMETRTLGDFPISAGDYIQVYLNYGIGFAANFSNISGYVEVAVDEI